MPASITSLAKTHSNTKLVDPVMTKNPSNNKFISSLRAVPETPRTMANSSRLGASQSSMRKSAISTGRRNMTSQDSPFNIWKDKLTH